MLPTIAHNFSSKQKKRVVAEFRLLVISSNFYIFIHSIIGIIEYQKHQLVNLLSSPYVQNEIPDKMYSTRHGNKCLKA